MKKNEKRWWVRMYLESTDEISKIQENYDIEIFKSTLRRIDSRNLLVDGYIPKRIYENLKSKYAVKILGDVEEMAKEASHYVSKTNRYEKLKKGESS